MTGPPDRMERLRKFGLSEYAARAYLALLDLGTTEARDVSRLGRIPLAKVYSTLDQLQEKGLVVVTPETPKKYSPVPFADFLDRLRREREEEARDLAAMRDEVASLFPIVGTTTMNDRGGVTTLRGRRNAVQKVRDLTAAAREEVLLVGSAGFPLRHPNVRDALEQARARGVRTRVLVPDAPPSGFGGSAPALPDARVRPHDAGQAMAVGLALFDRRIALMVHFIPDDASALNGKDVGVLVDEEALVQALQGFVERTWERAPPRAGEAADAQAGREEPLAAGAESGSAPSRNAPPRAGARHN